MSVLIEEIQRVVQVCKNRTMAILTYMIEIDPNLTVELDKDETLDMTQHTEHLALVGSKVTAEIRQAVQQNYVFVMTEATVELLATIVDIIQAEDRLIRKMTFMPVEARHGFIQLGNTMIEAISEIVKGHG